MYRHNKKNFNKGGSASSNHCVESIASEARSILVERYSIDVIDLADIFTLDSPYVVRKKLKILAQTYKSFQRIAITTIATHFFSVNFHFLTLMPAQLY